jgi:hypothetical protein
MAAPLSSIDRKNWPTVYPAILQSLFLYTADLM